jgi:hypothetical protein
MVSEWKQTSTVQEHGKVEVSIPELQPGQAVEVSIRFDDQVPARSERPLGLLKGKIQMTPNFDEPLEEFDDYQ